MLCSIIILFIAELTFPQLLLFNNLAISSYHGFIINIIIVLKHARKFYSWIIIVCHANDSNSRLILISESFMIIILLL